MKKWIITVILAIATALSSLAKEKAYFKEISTLPAVNYTYISPSMLSSMGDRSINTKAFSISATQLLHIESLKGGSTAVTYITGNITLNYSDFNY